MSFAIVRAGGKQFRVEQGATVRVPSLKQEVGASVELEVLATIAEGLTNKEIARRLDISLHTVKFHIESVFRKLGARTRTEAVTKAIERRRLETITL